MIKRISAAAAAAMLLTLLSACASAPAQSTAPEATATSTTDTNQDTTAPTSDATAPDSGSPAQDAATAFNQSQASNWASNPDPDQSGPETAVATDDSTLTVTLPLSAGGVTNFQSQMTKDFFTTYAVGANISAMEAGMQNTTIVMNIVDSTGASLGSFTYTAQDLGSSDSSSSSSDSSSSGNG